MDGPRNGADSGIGNRNESRGKEEARKRGEKKEKRREKRKGGGRSESGHTAHHQASLVGAGLPFPDNDCGRPAAAKKKSLAIRVFCMSDPAGHAAFFLL
jgi:hypothetical protein